MRQHRCVLENERAFAHLGTARVRERTAEREHVRAGLCEHALTAHARIVGARAGHREFAARIHHDAAAHGITVHTGEGLRAGELDFAVEFGIQPCVRGDRHRLTCRANEIAVRNGLFAGEELLNARGTERTRIDAHVIDIAAEETTPFRQTADENLNGLW